MVLKLKTAWRDGTTHLVMAPLEFMQRLAARATEGRPTGAGATAQAAPDPLGVGYANHGVLAPNAKLRALVVPQEPERHTQAAAPAEFEAGSQHHRPVRLTWAKLLKRVLATT